MPKDPGAQPSFTRRVRYADRQRQRQHLRRRQRHQQRHLGLQQSAVVRADLLSQVQRSVAHLVRDLQRAPEQRAQRRQSGSVAHRRPAATPFSLQRHAVQRAVPRAVRQPNPVSCTASVQTFLTYVNYSPTKMDNISYRLEWFDDKQGQRTGVEDALRRDRDRLAALVLAADRNPAGSVGVSLAGRAGVQR